MEFEGIGTSVIIVLSALLWFIYLFPTWLRRREYLATERNAVRLQQTLRIMAQTAQVPDSVRVEVTARQVAAQERVLRAASKAADARARADVAAAKMVPPVAGGAVTPAASRVQPVEGLSRSISTAKRLRRSRALTSLVLLVAAVGAVFGAIELLTAGAWLLLLSSAVVGLGAVVLLNQMRAVATARLRRSRAQGRERVSSPLHDESRYRDSEGSRQWTPVSLPKPLYLAHAAAGQVVRASRRR